MQNEIDLTTDSTEMGLALEKVGLRLKGKINIAEYLKKNACYSSLLQHVDAIIITVETENDGLRVNLLKSIDGSEHMLVYRLQRHIEQRLHEITRMPILNEAEISIAPDDFFRQNLALALQKATSIGKLSKNIDVSRDLIRIWQRQGLESKPFGGKPFGGGSGLFALAKYLGYASEDDLFKEPKKPEAETPTIQKFERLMARLPEKLTAFDICETAQWFLANTTTSEEEIIQRLDAGWSPGLAVTGAPNFDGELAPAIPPEWLVHERRDQIQQWLFKQANITSNGARNSVSAQFGSLVKDVRTLTKDLRVYIELTNKVDQYKTLASAQVIFSSVKTYFQPFIERLEKTIEQLKKH